MSIYYLLLLGHLIPIDNKFKYSKCSQFSLSRKQIDIREKLVLRLIFMFFKRTSDRSYFFCFLVYKAAPFKKKK